MATRNLTMVVNRQYAENHELGFAAPPSVYADNSYVNMYLHHDGYPEWQGVQLANWIKANARQDGAALSAKLVHDMYYDSCYLYANPDSIDHHYTYIIWTGKDDIYVSCWDQYASRCVFVSTPDKIIKTYKDDMDYTDFASGEKRCDRNNESNKVQLSHANATKIIDILTSSITN
tara:strand:+ start:31 stop:555 length:525 start_codon:yes stop_codon:yes gene_type:complete